MASESDRTPSAAHGSSEFGTSPPEKSERTKPAAAHTDSGAPYDLAGTMPDAGHEASEAAPDTTAAHTDLAALSERDFWPLIKQAKERVLTNDLDALESLIVDGLPADEMQAAAWALVQRVRGLKDDLARLEKARAAWQREAHRGS